MLSFVNLAEFNDHLLVSFISLFFIPGPIRRGEVKMKSILTMVLVFSFGNALAATDCSEGAIADNFGLFQSKNICTMKNLEQLASRVKKLESNCKIKHTSYEDYLAESCQYGDENACAKRKQPSKHITTDNHEIKLTGKDYLRKSFAGIMGKMSHSGRKIASYDAAQENEIIADCLDAFKGFETDMQKWQQEHTHVRKRSIRAR